MKFVHLAPPSNLRKIKRNGIRMGGGRRGRGVYAMPLFYFDVDDFTFVQSEAHRVRTLSKSSSEIWRQILFRHWEPRGRHASALVFSVTESYWPAQLYIKPRTGEWEKWLDAVCEICPLDGIIQDHGVCQTDYPRKVSLDVFRREDKNGKLDDDVWSARFSVMEEKTVGRIVNTLLQHGAFDSRRDLLEIVFPRRIPAGFIERTVPLHRTNADFKRRKRDSWTIDK